MRSRFIKSDYKFQSMTRVKIAIALLVASLILCAVITTNPKSKTDIHKNEQVEVLKKEELDQLMMDLAKMIRINNFIEMLHRGECMIDSKANDIPYSNGKSLADFINDALQTYSNKLSISPIPDSSILML